MSCSVALPAARAEATRAQIAAWLALLAVVLWLSLRGWGSFQVGVYQDDAVYTVLARSLTSGTGYGFIDCPGPSLTPKQPFAFPLLLAPAVWLFPHDLLAPTIVSLAATLFNLSLLFWGWPLLSPSTSRWWGLGVAWLHGCSPLVVGHTRFVLSEPVFTTFVLTALLLAEASARSKPRARRLAIPLGVTLTFALFTRTVGVVLVAAVVLRLLAVARRVGYAPLAGILAGGVGSLLLVLALTPIELRHLSPWQYVVELQTQHPLAVTLPSTPRSVVERALHTASGYFFHDVRGVLLPIGGGERERTFAKRLGMPLLPRAIGAAIAILACFGAWRAARTEALAAGALLFQALYSVPLLVWPWSVDRLLYPIQPLLALEVLLACVTIGDAIRRHPSGARRGPAVAVLVWMVLLALSVSKSMVVTDSRSFTRDFSVGGTWLAEHSPPDAIVMARYPHSVHLYGERRTVALEAHSREDLDRALDEEHVDFLLVAPALSWDTGGALAYDAEDLALMPALDEMTSRRRLTVVYESPPRDKVRVYRVERERVEGSIF